MERGPHWWLKVPKVSRCCISSNNPKTYLGFLDNPSSLGLPISTVVVGIEIILSKLAGDRNGPTIW